MAAGAPGRIQRAQVSLGLVSDRRPPCLVLQTMWCLGYSAAQGFDDEAFFLAGSLQPNQGGGIMAHNTTLEELQNRVNNDPFVSNDIVRAEILEITPAKADDRLQFLCN